MGLGEYTDLTVVWRRDSKDRRSQREIVKRQWRLTNILQNYRSATRFGTVTKSPAMGMVQKNQPLQIAFKTCNNDRADSRCNKFNPGNRKYCGGCPD